MFAESAANFFILLKVAYFGIKIRIRLDFSVKIILSILSDFLWPGILVNFIITEFKFCKIAQLFLCVSFSGQRKSERIERIIFTEKSSLKLVSA